MLEAAPTERQVLLFEDVQFVEELGGKESTDDEGVQEGFVLPAVEVYDMVEEDVGDLRLVVDICQFHQDYEQIVELY